MFNYKSIITLGCALALLSNATYGAADPGEYPERMALSSPRASSLNQSPREEENDEVPLEIFERIVSFSSPQEAMKLYLTCRTMRAAVLRRGHIKLISTIEDSQLEELASSYGTNLRSLNLQGCQQITPEALIAVSKNCPNLTSLDLEWCRQIPPEALITVSQNCRNLTSLYLVGWEQITPEALITVSKNCRNLTSLNLWQCDQITPEALITVSENCRKLTSLNLRDCSQFTPEALIAASQNCPNLNSLNLANCVKITDEALIAASQNCPNLNSLFLGTLPHITPETKRLIKEIRPGIKITD